MRVDRPDLRCTECGHQTNHFNGWAFIRDRCEGPNHKGMFHKWLPTDDEFWHKQVPPEIDNHSQEISEILDAIQGIIVQADRNGIYIEIELAIGPQSVKDVNEIDSYEWVQDAPHVPGMWVKRS